MSQLSKFLRVEDEIFMECPSRIFSSHDSAISSRIVYRMFFYAYSAFIECSAVLFCAVFFIILILCLCPAFLLRACAVIILLSVILNSKLKSVIDSISSYTEKLS